MENPTKMDDLGVTPFNKQPFGTCPATFDEPGYLRPAGSTSPKASKVPRELLLGP